MNSVVRVKAGWIKRLPDVVLGPFKTKQEAESAYKTSGKKKFDNKKEKKIEEKKFDNKKVEDSLKEGF